MDFDDILFESVRLFRENPDVLSEYQARFQYILVDEYLECQPCAIPADPPAVRRSSKPVRGRRRRDRSIYSFRENGIRNILDSRKGFQGCKVIKLEQITAPPAQLLGSQCIIKENEGRKAKKLWTNRGQGDLVTFLRAENHSEEGRYIATEINRVVSRRNKGMRYRDIAILYRLNALSRSLESALRDRGLPYRIFGGQRFYDRKEIRDVLAWLRLIRYPDDDFSLVRAIQVPRRGVGETTLERLGDLAAREGKSQLEICREVSLYPELQRTADRLRDFAAKVDSFRARLLQNDMSFAEYVEWIENESGLVQEIVDRRERSREIDPIDRIENLKELLSDALSLKIPCAGCRKPQQRQSCNRKTTICWPMICPAF